MYVIYLIQIKYMSSKLIIVKFYFKFFSILILIRDNSLLLKLILNYTLTFSITKLTHQLTSILFKVFII